tara:strand:- start:2783 stop:3019 length:237 start_codon:yes stop_codon:yes gene_type:complete
MIDEKSWPWEAQQEVNKLRAKVSKLRSKNDLNKVTRFEVIDHTARNSLRAIVRYNVNIELSFQDDGTTLKVFLKDGEP